VDRTVSSARRSQTKLPGGCQQGSFLLLWLWPRRRCDSLCGTVSPGEILGSRGLTVPMARRGAVVARCRPFLSHSVSPPQRGVRLPLPTRRPLVGGDRTHGHRLRSWRLPARLAHAVRAFFAGFVSGRPGNCSGLRCVHSTDCLSVG